MADQVLVAHYPKMVGKWLMACLLFRTLIISAAKKWILS